MASKIFDALVALRSALRDEKIETDGIVINMPSSEWEKLAGIVELHVGERPTQLSGGIRLFGFLVRPEWEP